MKAVIERCGVLFSVAAIQNMDECGMTLVDITRDILVLRDGDLSGADLLEYCLDGADKDRHEGWCDYVMAISNAALRVGAK